MHGTEHASAWLHLQARADLAGEFHKTALGFAGVAMTSDDDIFDLQGWVKRSSRFTGSINRSSCARTGTT
jgi:hypothetical protein